MKYAVKSVHRWSNIESDEVVVEASSARSAATKFARQFGSLGMLNYVTMLAVDPRIKRWYFEVMGTSGMVLDVTVNAEVRSC